MMKDQYKTKKELISDLVALRQRVAELEASEAERTRPDDEGRPGQERLRGSEEVADITERKRADQALRLEKAYFGGLFHGSPEAIALVDNDSHMLRVNPAFTKLFGYTPEEAIGRSVDELLAPKELQAEAFSLTKRAAEGERLAVETVRRAKDGRLIDVSLLGAPIIVEDKQVAVCGIYRDISEQKRAEEVLRQSEDRYRSILESIEDGYYEVDLDGNWTFFNEALSRITGFPSDELAGVSSWELMDEENAKRVRRTLDKVYRTGEPIHGFHWEIVRKDGARRVVEASVSPIRDTKGSFTGFQGIMRDVTERKRVEDAVRQSRERLRNLAARLHAVREEERTLIAREIHDELGQSLTGLKMDLAWLGDRLPRNKKALRERMGSMVALVDRTINVVRELSSQLRPAVLDDLGLVAAIEWQTRDFAARSGVDCALELGVENIDLDRDRATALFRILQETLTNVARHAAASHVRVALRATEHDLVLEVADDGKGISDGALISTQSLGLIGMRERAGALGGRAEISRVAEGGTRVKVRVARSENGL